MVLTEMTCVYDVCDDVECLSVYDLSYTSNTGIYLFSYKNTLRGTPGLRFIRRWTKKEPCKTEAYFPVFLVCKS
jgi:hypothetical protein